MNFSQLEYFQALVQHGSYSRAAGQLHITQPALSLQIGKLEEEVGFKLIDRRKRPLELTREGEVFHQRVSEILLKMKQLTDLSMEMGEEIQGTLKTGIIPTLAPYLVPLFIGDLNRRYPKLQVEISELKTEEIIRRIKTGTLDLGILSTPVSTTGIEFTPLFYEQFFAYISPNHPLFSKNQVSIEAINEEEIWYLEEGNCFQNQVNSICQVKSPAQPGQPLVYRSHSIESLRRIVENKGGITFIPELATMNVSAGQEDLIKEFEGTPPAREISLVSLRNPVYEKQIQALQSAILENIPRRMRKKPSGWVVDTQIRL